MESFANSLWLWVDSPTPKDLVVTPSASITPARERLRTEARLQREAQAARVEDLPTTLFEATRVEELPATLFAVINTGGTRYRGESNTCFQHLLRFMNQGKV